jgi:hypothetical protein
MLPIPSTSGITKKRRSEKLEKYQNVARYRFAEGLDLFKLDKKIHFPWLLH